MIFRMNKTTRNHDDFRVLITGALIAIGILILNDLSVRLKEQRWYRDITGITPFYDTELLYSSVTLDTITIGGVLIKRRCTFNALTGFISNKNGNRFRVAVDHRADQPPGTPHQ